MADTIGLVTAEVLARLFGLSVRRVQQLAQSGIVPRAKANSYPLAASIQGYVRFLKEDKTHRGDIDEALDIDRARVRNLNADTTIKQLREEQIRGELVRIEVIEWILSSVSAQISSVLETIPMKVSRRVPGLKATEIEIITREVIKAQNAASAVMVKLDDYAPIRIGDDGKDDTDNDAEPGESDLGGDSLRNANDAPTGADEVV